MRDVDDIVSWYESSLPRGERKKRGHFSTPPQLVQEILDACGYTPEADLSQIRVLDPACGSGNFLAGVARRLLASGQRAGLTQEEQTALFQRNIWGLDPDPISCFLAEMQLQTILNLNAHHCAPTFHIHQADGLTLPWEPCIDLFLANPPYLAAKNNDLSAYQSAQRGQTDSYLLFLNLAFQVIRPNGWIGLVLPDPLLARANASRERRRLLEEFTLHHLWHLSGVFAAEVAAVVLIAQKRPPQPTHQVTWARTRYIRGTRYIRRGGGGEEEGRGPSWSPVVPMEENGQAVWSPVVPVCAADMELGTYGDPGDGRPQDRELGMFDTPGHGRPQGSPPRIHATPAPTEDREKTIAQALLLQQPGAELRYLLSSEQGATIERLCAYLAEASVEKRRLAPLRDSLLIRRGEELGRESPYITQSAMGVVDGRGDLISQSLPILRGGIDIRPYLAPTTSWSIARDAIKKPLERYLTPKLLVVKSTQRLQAALDLQGHVALQTLYLLRPCEKSTPESTLDTLYFFLALLNSRLLQEYVYVLHTAYKWVQPQIEQSVLSHLPVPIVGEEARQDIVTRAKLLHACGEGTPVVEWGEPISKLYEEQECAIRALYDSALKSYCP